MALGNGSIFGVAALVSGFGLGFLDRKFGPSGLIVVRAFGSAAFFIAAFLGGKPTLFEMMAMALIGYWSVLLEIRMRTGLWK